MRRKIPVVGALVALAAAGFAGATLISAQADESPPPEDPAGAAPDRGTVKFQHVAKDPGGGPDWTLRSHTRGGKLCLTVGRRSERGTFGHVTGDRFVPQRDTHGGGAPCGMDRGENTRLLTYDREAGPGGRTSVYGTTAADTRTVVITAPGGDVRRIEPADDGTYLAVFEGVLTLSGSPEKEVAVSFE